MMCGRQDVGADLVEAALAGGPPALCGRCRREVRPTAMDIVLDGASMTAREFADTAGVPLRTVLRAARGERMSRRVAGRLERITGISWRVWRPT